MSKVKHLLLIVSLSVCLVAQSTVVASSSPGRPIIGRHNVDQLQVERILGKGHVGTIAWSPDGKILAVGSTTGVWLYDTADFKHTPLWLGNLDFPGMMLKFSPDGKQLVTYNRLTKINVWDLTTHTLHAEIKLENQGFEEITTSGSGIEFSPIYDVSFMPDSRLLVISALSDDQGFHIWDGYTRQDLVIDKGTEPHISSVDYSPDGKTVALGIQIDLGEPGEIRLWSLETGKKLAVYQGPTAPVDSVAYSPDGRYLATGTGSVPSDYADAKDDNNVRLWDARTGKVLALMKGHDFWVEKVIFSSDGSLLASGSGDYTIRLWSIKDHAPRAILKGHKGWIRDIAFSPDGKWLASSSGDGSVRIWSISGARERFQLADFSGSPNIYVGPGAPYPSYEIAFSPDSASLGLIRATGVLQTWNLANGDETALPGLPNGTDAHQQLDALANPSKLSTWNNLSYYSGKLKAATYFSSALSSDGSRLLFQKTIDGESSNETVTHLWSANPQKQIAVLPYGDSEYVVFSPDSRWIIVMPAHGYQDAEIIRIDAVTGKEKGRFYRTRIPLPSRFLPDGPSPDAKVIGWRFSADGKRLAVAYADGYVMVCNLDSGLLTTWLVVPKTGPEFSGDSPGERPGLVTEAVPDFTYMAEFTSNLDRVAFYFYDGDYKIWDLDGSRTVSIGEGKNEQLGGTFNKDEHLLFTFDKNMLNIWDTYTGKLVKSITSRSTITNYRLSPDGTMLTVVNDDDAIELWTIQPEKF